MEERERGRMRPGEIEPIAKKLFRKHFGGIGLWGVTVKTGLDHDDAPVVDIEFVYDAPYERFRDASESGPTDLSLELQDMLDEDEDRCPGYVVPIYVTREDFENRERYRAEELEEEIAYTEARSRDAR